MTNRILLIALLFIGCNSNAQEKIWTKQTRIGEVLAYETSNDQTRFLDYDIVLPFEYYPAVHEHPVTKPVIAQRPEIEYLPVTAQYYFSSADSMLRFISYEWAKRYKDVDERQKLWKEEPKKLDKYNKEYERIKKILLAQLGNPTESDTKPQEVKAPRESSYARSTVWENDKVHATLTLTFSSMIFSIKMMLYWK